MAAHRARRVVGVEVVRARKSLAAGVIVKAEVILIDAFLMAAAAGEGSCPNAEEGKADDVRFSQRFEAMSFFSSSAVDSWTSPIELSKPRPPARPMAASSGARPLESFSLRRAP